VEYLLAKVYVPGNSRLSEVINDQQRSFLTLTNVKANQSDSAIGKISELMLISKRAIRLISPMSDENTVRGIIRQDTDLSSIRDKKNVV